ncbi:small multi-drug export protein [Patescibacteria group bacterium]|nr:small multi-drug export protein [Patescibacteria group bacterium]
MFNLDYVQIFQSWPEELSTFLISTIPIAELRAAIPIALGSFNLSVASAYFYAVIGNMFPVIFILWWLEPVSKWLSRHFKFMAKFFNWLFTRTRTNHSKKFERWGAVALITFVAIPLPITGAWTGSVAAFVFGIPFKKAFPLIFVGVLIAGVIVTIASLSAFSLFN